MSPATLTSIAVRTIPLARRQPLYCDTLAFWSGWSRWSMCNNDGVHTRDRECADLNSAGQVAQGKYCAGEKEQTIECENQECDTQ